MKVKLPAPNRLAVYLTAGAALAGALAPVVANLDLTSTVGVESGVAALAAVVIKWLSGWQNLEKAEAQNHVHALATEREAAYAAEARAQATQPRSAVSKLNLPR